MDIPDNDFSAIDREFREIAAQDSRFLDRSTFQVLDLDHELLTYRRQCWPTFLGTAKQSAIRDASLSVSRLLRLVPERVFGGDPARVADFFRISDLALVELLMRPPNGIEGAVSRGDFIDTPAGFKCIEFNMGANLGGWETRIIADLMLGIPAIADFLAARRTEVLLVDTVAILYEHVIAEAISGEIAPEGELNIAFTTRGDSRLGRTSGFDKYLNEEYAKVCARLDRSLHGRVVRCDDFDFARRPDGLYLGQLRIHAVVEVDSGSTMPETYQTFKLGQTLLYNGPNNFMMTSKRILALLSEHRDSDRFSVEEREQIQRFIPWTVQVLPHFVPFWGERVFVPDFLLQERERLVLKDPSSCGGAGVRLGKFLSPAEWENAVGIALEAGDWQVQEALEFKPVVYQSGDYGCSPHNVIWGPFVFGPHYAGVILRMQPDRVPGAVNLTLTATEGIVFGVDSP